MSKKKRDARPVQEFYRNIVKALAREERERFPHRRYHVSLSVEGDSIGDLLTALEQSKKAIKDNFNLGLDRGSKANDCYALGAGIEEEHWHVEQAVVRDEGPERTPGAYKALVEQHGTWYRMRAREAMEELRKKKGWKRGCG